MVFSIHTHTNLLGYQIIPTDVWEERDVEEWGVKQKMKSHILFSFRMDMCSFKAEPQHSLATSRREGREGGLRVSSF